MTLGDDLGCAGLGTLCPVPLGSSSDATDENFLGPSDPDLFYEVIFEGATYRVPFVVSEDGDLLLQGDIQLGKLAEFDLEIDAKLQAIGDLNLQGLFALGNFKWPLGIVPYEVGPDLDRETIERAMAAWTKGANIVFRERGASEVDYVYFSHSAKNTCSSTVGMKQGKQTVVLGPKCKLGNIAHEIGHVIGLAHEQMRVDREDHVVLHEENVADGYKGNFLSYPSKYQAVGSYCYDSIMHYGKFAFSKNGLPTLEPRAEVEIGQRSQLSGCDLQTIQEMYRDEISKRQ